MISNLIREKQLAQLYRQVQKMSHFADETVYGYSNEKFRLLDKIYGMRIDCLEKDIEDTQEVFNQYNDQANLIWSSSDQGRYN